MSHPETWRDFIQGHSGLSLRDTDEAYKEHTYILEKRRTRKDNPRILNTMSDDDGCKKKTRGIRCLYILK